MCQTDQMFNQIKCIKELSASPNAANVIISTCFRLLLIFWVLETVQDIALQQVVMATVYAKSCTIHLQGIWIWEQFHLRSRMSIVDPCGSVGFRNWILETIPVQPQILLGPPLLWSYYRWEVRTRPQLHYKLTQYKYYYTFYKAQFHFMRAFIY